MRRLDWLDSFIGEDRDSTELVALHRFGYTGDISKLEPGFVAEVEALIDGYSVEDVFGLIAELHWGQPYFGTFKTEGYYGADTAGVVEVKSTIDASIMAGISSMAAVNFARPNMRLKSLDGFCGYVPANHQFTYTYSRYGDSVNFLDVDFESFSSELRKVLNIPDLRVCVKSSKCNFYSRTGELPPEEAAYFFACPGDVSVVKYEAGDAKTSIMDYGKDYFLGSEFDTSRLRERAYKGSGDAVYGSHLKTPCIFLAGPNKKRPGCHSTYCYATGGSLGRNSVLNKRVRPLIGRKRLYKDDLLGLYAIKSQNPNNVGVYLPGLGFYTPVFEDGEETYLVVGVETTDGLVQEHDRGNFPMLVDMGFMKLGLYFDKVVGICGYMEQVAPVGSIRVERIDNDFWNRLGEV